MNTQPLIHVRVEAESGCAMIAISPRGEDPTVDAAVLESAAARAGIAITDHVRAKLAALADAFRVNPRDMECIIAEPTAPQNGEDGWIEWCEGCDPTACVQKLDEHGRIDHYAGCAFIHVKQGAHIATLHQPTPGTDGCDVMGKPIKAESGSVCAIKVDSSLAIDSDGRIFAQTEGALHIKNEVLAITKLFEVPEHVDFSTGNINFDGCIEIRQDVRDLFQIKATGSVNVGGLIEAATIDCGGDFVGRRGMAGRGRGELRASGNVEIGFLNDMSGSVGGTLSVRREIIGCDLRVAGALNCEQCTIIGGSLELHGKGIVAAIGSASNRPTRIVLDENANLVVAKAIHPSVTLQIGSTIYEIDRLTKGPVRIVAESKSALAYRIADGVPRPMSEIAKTHRAAA